MTTQAIQPGFYRPDMPGLPQPREGVTGIDRSTDLLISLADEALVVRRAMIGSADCLHSACLVGNPAPVVQEMYARMTPQPGDLIVEDTARIGARYEKWAERIIHGFGYFITRRIEWAETDAEWATVLAGREEGGSDERLADEYWYVQYGPDPADVCRWTNCHWVAVLTDRRAP